MVALRHPRALLALVAALACCTAQVAQRASPEQNAPCDTGAGVVALVENGLYAYAIAVDDASVYVASTTGVWRVAKTGGAPSLVGASESVSAIAVDAQRVYWIGGHSAGGGPKPQSTTALFAAPIAAWASGP